MYKIIFILLVFSSMCFSQFLFITQISHKNTENITGDQVLNSVKLSSNSEFRFSIDSIYSKLIMSEVQNGVTFKSDTFTVKLTNYDLDNASLSFDVQNDKTKEKLSVCYVKDYDILYVGSENNSYKDGNIFDYVYYDVIHGGEKLFVDD